MKNISKLLKDYRKFQNKADNALAEITQECQHFSTMTLHLFYQPSDGLCFSIDRVKTSGLPMNVPLILFREAVGDGNTLNEFDLDKISI